MIIDFHTHVFPDGIAQKASDNIGKFYDIPTQFDGTLSTLLALGKAAGVDRYVVHSVATTPNQTASINGFIAGLCRENPGVYGFATIHPDQEDMEGEIERALNMGLKGVKIHSDMQKVALDDPRLFRLYDLIAGKVPLLAHTGDNRFDYSNPDRLNRVLDAFPKLTVVGAHFGGWSVWEEALEALKGRNLYVDCSSSFYAIAPEAALKLIRGYGAQRVLFGSDYPMWDPGVELQYLYKLGLLASEMELILHENAERLLGI
jgi:predicted TIM-barrel fold metal-dependent hydrolase